MPPRYAYWTILIDGKATAFRARDRAELLPTFNQLARKNADIAIRYFSRGRLWDTPEQAQWAARNIRAEREHRSKEWRPGGAHKDPRARFEPRAKGGPGQPRADRFPKPRGERPAGTGEKPSAKPDERRFSKPERERFRKPAARRFGKPGDKWAPKTPAGPAAKPPTEGGEPKSSEPPRGPGNREFRGGRPNRRHGPPPRRGPKPR